MSSEDDGAAPLFEVRALTKRFGGLRAIDDLSLAIAEGGIQAVIGPNGSGKTTLLNLISGIYAPTSGSIAFLGRDITALRPDLLAHLGLARTFQNLQVCMNMTVLENVLVGAHLRTRRGLLAGLVHPRALRRSEAELVEEALDSLEDAGLRAQARQIAASMPYGALKKLEIARALALKPRVLLLDEPAAGLNPTEKIEISRLLRKIGESGVTIVLVEHDMRMVMGLSDRVLVLDRGRLLAAGSPAEVQANPEVIAAYLGGVAEASP